MPPSDAYAVLVRDPVLDFWFALRGVLAPLLELPLEESYGSIWEGSPKFCLLRMGIGGCTLLGSQCCLCAWGVFESILSRARRGGDHGRVKFRPIALC